MPLEQHDDEHEGPAGAKGGKGSKQHRDNLLIIAGTLGVLIFTYLIWRGSGSSSKQQVTSGGGTGGQVAGGGQSGAYNDQYLQQIYQQMADTLTQNQQSQSDALAGFQEYLQMLADQLGNQTPAAPTAPAAPEPTVTGPGFVAGGGGLREWALRTMPGFDPKAPILWDGWDSGLPTSGPGGIGPQSPDDVLNSGHWSGNTLVGGWYKRPDGSLYSVGS